MDCQVLVVGAGPAGLLLSIEQALSGVRVMILEKLSEPTGQSRGLGFTCVTKDIFDQRGLLEEFGEVEVSNAGHFGGIPVDFSILEGSQQAAKTVPQNQTEAVLERRAIEAGVDLRRGVEVIEVSQDADGVNVVASDEQGQVQHIRAQYLIGCDGGRSTIRRLGGFIFEGVPATREMFLADVLSTEKIATRMIGEVTNGGMVMSAPLPNGTTRIVVCERVAPPKHRNAPPEFSEVAAGWQRITGEDISDAEAVWVSAFGDTAFQATEYRRGRIFLAGDSAHIHLPAGGQGMNASLQDSFNLGWKLAAVVRGETPDSLLDSYEYERHPVGERLLDNTRAQGVLFLRGDEAAPFRNYLASLVTHEDVAKLLAAKVSGLDIVYPMGGGSHSLLGRRVPDVELQTATGAKTSTLHLLRHGKHVLLDFRGSQQLQQRAAPWSNRVHIHQVEEVGSHRLDGTSALLLRPDGYVAWTAPGSDQPLEVVMTTWCGAPQQHLVPA